MQGAITLLCLPCAGASATMYLRWRRLLPGWIQVVPVELPGRGTRMGEPFENDFGALVERLCKEQARALRGSYAIFGHSMGSLLAWGMARHLRAQGCALPTALLASGSPAPSHRDPERFASRNDDEALMADLRKQGGTPEEVFASAELMSITLSVLGADYRVCESFSYPGADPLSMPLHVFAGREDEIEKERIEAWAVEAGGSFSLDWFDGGHFFIRQSEQAVLKALARRLAESVAGGANAARAFA
ncbi:MAG: alpha/beta fold hydrolase [Acidovorax sp.]